MSIILEIEYLTGTSFASIGPDSDAPDWPPQPDRVFSALVATWASRGENEEEAKGLQWLEALPAPIIEASGHEPRSAPITFVPPNDSETGRSGDKSVMPVFRRRQPRRFPATRPHVPIVRILWESGISDELFTHLRALAADTAYIGHSVSLTRCQFIRSDHTYIPMEATQPVRCVYPGRFSELRQAFADGRRPMQGQNIIRHLNKSANLSQNIFSDQWLVFEHIDQRSKSNENEMPDIRASALMAKVFRDALLSGYKRIGLENDIPEVVSGHKPDRGPTALPHLAIVPLAYAGSTHADGHIMGFALVPPRGSPILENDSFKKVLRAIAPFDDQSGRRILSLRPKSGTSSDRTFSIALSPIGDLPTNKRSLDTERYTASAQVFATLTPIVLDRHLKENGTGREEEIINQIKGACLNAGLPEPVSVAPGKHSAIEGAPAVRGSGNAPSWMNWRLPPSIASRHLTHALIQFPQPIAGPVIIGAGRFVGMGLCLPHGNPEEET